MLGILKIISPNRIEGTDQKAVSARIAKLRKVSRRIRVASGSARTLHPIISQKLEQARRS